MKWKEYPAGADISVFDKCVEIYVTFNEGLKLWEGGIHPGLGKGLLIVGQGKSKREAMVRSEDWLRRQAYKLLDGLEK